MQRSHFIFENSVAMLKFFGNDPKEKSMTLERVLAHMPSLQINRNLMQSFPALSQLTNIGVVTSLFMVSIEAMFGNATANVTKKTYFHKFFDFTFALNITTGIFTVLKIAQEKWPTLPRIEGLSALSLFLLSALVIQIAEQHIEGGQNISNQAFYLSLGVNVAAACALLHQHFSELGAARLVASLVLPILIARGK